MVVKIFLSGIADGVERNGTSNVRKDVLGNNLIKSGAITSPAFSFIADMAVFVCTELVEVVE